MISNRTRSACCSLAFLAWNRGLLIGVSNAAAFVPLPLVAIRNHHHHHYHHPTLRINNSHCAKRTIVSSSSSSLTMSADTEQQQVEVNVGAHLQEVRDAIAKACEASGRDINQVRLVAVSKTKPLELLKQAYASGQRVFGENYAQELVDKAQAFFGEGEDTKDIQWHFIGALQSNKANMLVKGVVPYGKLVVETVSSFKVAKKLDAAMNEHPGKKLDIFVQINTSGEESKSGVSSEEVVELCQQIINECQNLQLKGVMTIGAPGDTECLDALVACRDQVARALNKSPCDLEVSMGMSDDFEIAIAKGSTNVRIGSTIFGARDYSNKK